MNTKTVVSPIVVPVNRAALLPLPALLLLALTAPLPTHAQIQSGGGGGGNSGQNGGLGGGGGGHGSSPLQGGEGGNGGAGAVLGSDAQNGEKGEDSTAPGGAGGEGSQEDLTGGGGGGGGGGYGSAGGAGGDGGKGTQIYLGAGTVELMADIIGSAGTAGNGGGGGTAAGGNGGGGGGGAGLVLQTEMGETFFAVNGHVIRGGAGGGSPTGAGGGGGGAGMVLIGQGSVVNDLSGMIAGGSGGATAGFFGSATGGSGGAAVFIYNGGKLENLTGGTVTGGQGGGGLGLGGVGGAGVLANSGEIENDAIIAGGKGGNGGTVGSTGGRGGDGVVVYESDVFNHASGSITGGDGGLVNSTFATNGGSGGHGVVFIAGGVGGMLVNEGVITGGNGGSAQFPGVGGVGVLIASDGTTVINKGAIRGPGGVAVELSGNHNTFELWAGSSLDGNVLSTGSGNTLSLGGSVNATFNLSDVGGQPFKFQGFTLFAKTGTSTWTLLGSASQETPWAISAGTLQVGDGGTTGSTRGDITNDAALIFNRSNALTYDGVISGSGTMTKQGGGVLTLTNDHIYTGQTTIDAGTLQLGNGGSKGSLQGDIINRAALIFNRSNDLSYGGMITGEGTFTKRGSGALTLSNAHTFTGATELDAGTVIINDSFASSIVTVKAGATLGGSGVLVGDVTILDGGILSPGDAVEVFTVGSLTLNPTSQVNFHLGAPGGANNRVSVLGDLALRGILNLSTTAEFSTGSYRLFDYDGSLTHNGLGFGLAPAGYNLVIDTSIEHQVNLLVDYNGLQFWNGTTTTPNGVVNGGSGSWDAASTNWTDENGNVSVAWDDLTAVFSGPEGGEVSVNHDVKIAGLQFATDGYHLLNGGGALVIDDSATEIRLDSGIGVTISTDIAGDGGLVKTGGGTLTLNGDLQYTGPTTVLAGTLATGDLTHSTLQLQSGGSFSPDGEAAEGITVGGLQLNGGKLLFDIGNEGTDHITIVDGLSVLNAATEFVFTDSGLSNGMYSLLDGLAIGWDLGLLSYSGISPVSATFLLSEDGTALYLSVYTGGLISGPILQNSAPVGTPVVADFLVDGPVTTGTPTEDNTINSLTFNPESSLNIFNTLTVTSGGFEVASGEVTVSGGVIVASNTFTKTGGGTITFNNQLFVNGAANVEAGSLLVNGVLAANGPLTVYPQATLGGTGTISAAVYNNGTVAPGNSPGTLTVVGSYTQSKHASLEIEVASPALFDRLVVTREAHLAGTLDVRSYAGHRFEYGDVYTFLFASKIKGSFDEILSPDRSRFRMRFIADSGEGSIIVAPSSYTLVARNANERSVAKALDRFIEARSGDREKVSIALDIQSEEAYANAFAQVSPAFYGGLTRMMFNQANSQNQLLAQRFDHNRLAGNAARGFQSLGIEVPLTTDRDGKSVVSSGKATSVLEATPENRWGVWVQGTGSFAKVPHVLQLPNKHYAGGGFLVGADYEWSDVFTSGLFGGYQGVRADYGDGNEIGMDSALFGAYAAWQANGLRGNMIVSGAQHQFDVSRGINFSTIDRQANSDPQARQFNAYLDLGCDVKVGDFSFGPIAAGQYSYVNRSSFSEDGANSLNLNVDKQESHSLRSDLGARIAYTARVSSEVLVIPEVRASWSHEFLNEDQTLTSTFSGAPGQPMSYQVASPHRDSINIGAGVSAAIRQSWNIGVFYNANLARGSNDTSHIVSASVGWRF